MAVHYCTTRCATNLWATLLQLVKVVYRTRYCSFLSYYCSSWKLQVAEIRSGTLSGQVQGWSRDWQFARTGPKPVTWLAICLDRSQTVKTGNLSRKVPNWCHDWSFVWTGPKLVTWLAICLDRSQAVFEDWQFVWTGPKLVKWLAICLGRSYAVETGKLSGQVLGLSHDLSICLDRSQVGHGSGKLPGHVSWRSEDGYFGLTHHDKLRGE